MKSVASLTRKVNGKSAKLMKISINMPIFKANVDLK